MASLIVPPLEPDDERWPTLGPQVCDFIEDRWVYGPGPLKGAPYVIEPEFRAWLYRAYEVFPQGHERAGRRRFKRCVMSLRKGTAKTEKGAVVTATEVHPDAPVRCDGFNADGFPVGRPVVDPFIPMLAYAKDQAEELGYAVVKTIIEESADADMFDIGLERILLLDARGRKAGEIKAQSGSPSARDGARTTFNDFDETHHLYLPSHVKAHNTMVQNAFKRRDADAWSMEHTTAPEAGQGSVAEMALELAELIRLGKTEDSALFLQHRQGTWPEGGIKTREECMAYLMEASGPSAVWAGDLPALVDHFFEPTTDVHYFRRVWGNEKVAGSGRAFNVVKFEALKGERPPDGELVTVGFDGARNRDATALVCTHVDSKYQWVAGVWERPEYAPDDWVVDATEVTEVLATVFDRHGVWRVYCDPHHWGSTIDQWSGEWGDRIISWDTTKWKAIGYACRKFNDEIELGTMSFDGSDVFVSHIANSHRRNLRLVDEDTGQPLWTIQKERPDSPLKIDVAMAAILSMAACHDAIAAGARLETAQHQAWAF